MKAFIVQTIARQINGEYIVVKIEKAFSRASKADEYAKNLAKNYNETINTPSGPVQCLCERGVIEIEIEE